MGSSTKQQFKFDQQGNLQVVTATGRFRKHWKNKFREISKKFLKKRCDNCNSTENLTIHHMVPLNVAVIITKKNCQTLCVECHNALEQDIQIKTFNHWVKQKDAISK